MKIKYSTAIALFAAFFLISASLPAEAALSHEDAGKVWRKVASATGLENLPFNVKVEKIPNAWVTNGQSVTVTTGLLAMLSTKAELYGVLAHEAGHAKLGHYEKTVNRAAGLGVAASILGNIFGDGVGDIAVGVGANLAYAGWSREQEVEADDYSVHLAQDNGEDPVGLYSAMLKLSNNGSRTQPSGFNSHPPDERRLLHIRNEILRVKPNAKFPDGSEKSVPQRSDEQKTVPVTVKPAEKSKTDGYDINAKLEQMKKEAAAKKSAEEKN